MTILNILSDGLHFLTHLTEYLEVWLKNYGVWFYAILALIIFVETGLVVMPLLPGDSLLFAAGALASSSDSLNVWFIIPLLIVAALLGDNTNYFIGSKIGIKIFDLKWRFLKKEYLTKTEAFYEKHGGSTLIMARFVPIIRTFAPFVAGLGSMSYRRFLIFSVTGAVLWVTSITLLGYFFGSLPWVKQNFEIVVFGIIGVSLLPIVFQYLKHKFGRKSE